MPNIERGELSLNWGIANMIDERVITEKDKAVCKMGTVPATIVSMHNNILYSDNAKVIVDSELGNPFSIGGFGVCRIVPSAPKPCVPMVVRWTGTGGRFRVNNLCSPLTERAKGVCACAGLECISFI